MTRETEQRAPDSNAADHFSEHLPPTARASAVTNLEASGLTLSYATTTFSLHGRPFCRVAQPNVLLFARSSTLFCPLRKSERRANR
jgi:hypothetical protein